MPGCHPHFGIDYPPGGGSHTRAFEAAARTMQAHENTLKAAAGIADVGARFLRDEAFAAEVGFSPNSDYAHRVQTKAWYEYDMKAL